MQGTVCMYVCMSWVGVCMRACAYVCVCMYVYDIMFVLMHECMRVMYACTHVCMSCMYLRMHVCVYACNVYM